MKLPLARNTPKKKKLVRLLLSAVCPLSSIPEFKIGPNNHPVGLHKGRLLSRTAPETRELEYSAMDL